MAKPKDDITTYTKPELIKALRASVAREAKLQKQVTKLHDAAKASAFGPELDEDHGVVHVTQELGTLTNQDLDARIKDDDQAPPAFPWEPK